MICASDFRFFLFTTPVSCFCFSSSSTILISAFFLSLPHKHHPLRRHLTLSHLLSASTSISTWSIDIDLQSTQKTTAPLAATWPTLDQPRPRHTARATLSGGCASGTSTHEHTRAHTSTHEHTQTVQSDAPGLHTQRCATTDSERTASLGTTSLASFA